MPSLINALMKDATDLDDQTIANDMLMGSKQAATTYLTAILESSTPELRAMYSTSLNQVLAGHESLTTLAINRGWYQPYNSPEEQLSETLNQSRKVINFKEEEAIKADQPEV